VQRNPIQEWLQRKHDKYKKHEASEGTDPRRPPTTDKGDREHDCQCLDSFDKRTGRLRHRQSQQRHSYGLWEVWRDDLVVFRGPMEAAWEKAKAQAARGRALLRYQNRRYPDFSAG
jgi:hypothetical protein